MTDAIDQAFQTATDPQDNPKQDPIDAAWSQATQPPKTGLMDTASHVANYYYGAARTEASKVLSAFSVGFQDKWGANQQIIDKDLKAELQAKGQEKNYKDQNEMNWANWSTILRHGLAEGGNYASATTEATYRAVNQGISDLGKLPSEEELLKLGFKPEDIHKAYQMVKDSGVGPAIKAATHGFERGAAPAAATMAAGVKGAEIGAGLGAMVPGLGETGISEAVGGIAGGIAFGLAGNEAAQKAQDYLLSKVPDKWKSLIGQSDKEQQQEQIKHPLATFTGELLPYAASFRPGLLPKVVPKNASMLTKALAHPLGQRALSGVLMGDWEAVQELWNEGKTDSDKVAVAAAIGTFFPRNEVAEKVKILNDNSTAPRIEPTFEKAKANGIIGDEGTEEQQRAKAEAVGNLPSSATRNPQPNETVQGPHSVEEALAYQPVTDKTISKDASKMLTDVGRPKNEASAIGTLVQHYFETRAARFKGTLGTPRELFDKEFPEIVNAGKAGMFKSSDNELNQPDWEDLQKLSDHRDRLLNKTDQILAMYSGEEKESIKKQIEVAVNSKHSLPLTSEENTFIEKYNNDVVSGKVGSSEEKELFDDLTKRQWLHQHFGELIETERKLKQDFPDLRGEYFQSNKKSYKTLSHEEAKKLVASGAKLKQVGLYEPEHNPNQEYVFVKHSDGGTRFWKIIRPKGQKKEYSQMVFHGSGAGFDKFDNRYIGTGEGAQMYGVGHYFADKRDIAEFYRTQEASKTSEGKGYVYTAELTPKDHEWLDLDKNVQDQSPEIQDRLRKAGLWNGERMTTHGLQTEIAKGLYFGDIQQARAMTSRALHQAGIPGLRYTGLTHKLEVAKAEQDLPIYKEQLENARLVRDVTKRQQLSSLPLKEDTVNKLQETVDRLEKLVANPTAFNYVVFDPANVNIVNKEYYQDHEGKTRETFYSALSHGVEDVKQSKAPADQWLKTIKNIKGIKKEELDWSGIETWLKSQTGKVSKEDIQKFLAENQVDVKEVQHGQPKPPEFLEAYEHLAYLRDHGGQLSHHDFNRRVSELEKKYNLSPETKYGQYILPGGKDYRELLLTLPTKDTGLYGQKAADAYNQYHAELHEKYGDGIQLKATPEELHKLNELSQRSITRSPTQDFRSGHWNEPNVLAHVRFDTRAGKDGEKILHVAEIQSDWHQKGRRQGYGDSPEKKRLQEQQEELRGDRPVTFETQQLLNHFDGNREDALAEVTHALNGGSFRDGIPDAPFKQSWHELAIKRMLRYATDNGFDRLSWDTGETNADRFSLSHQVSEIRYFPSEGGALLFKTIDGHQHQLENISPEKLDDYIGKEAADRIKNKINKDDTEIAPTGNKYVRLEGLDLKIGGEGMKGFYDKILTDFVKRYTKKWGAEVKDIPLTYDLGDINKEFDLVERGGRWYIKDLASDIVLNTAFNSGADAEKWLKENYSKQTQVHSVTITPKMKESVQEGQPLFQRGKRGSLVLQDGRNVLKIFEVADHSTVIHELGHDWLEALHRDAAHEDAPEDIKRDTETVRDWYNSKRGRAKEWTGDDIPRSAHEMWARGFERYLMEGKAPSKPLATVFAKFKAWLTRIYQSVTKLKSPINDDVRAVFDRLLSTEPQKTEIADVPEKTISPEATEEPLPQDAGEGVPTAEAPLPEKEKTQTELAQSKADLITPDGKFRVKQLTSYDDLDRATKSFITRNINKIEARKGKLTDEDIVNYAANLGLDPKDSDHTKLDALFGGPDVPLAGKVYAVGQYMQDATKALVEAIEAEDVESAVVLRQNLVKSMAIFAGKIRPDWGYTGRALQSLYGEAEKADALNEFFQSTIGKNTKEFKAELARMKALAKKRGITVEELVKQLRKEAEPKWGHMINEFYRSNLITGIMTHLHYFEANKMWALWRAYPTTAFQAGASSMMQMFSKEPIDKVRWGELAEISYNLKYAQAEALKAAADSFKVGQSVGRTMQRVAKEKADYELSKGLITDKEYLGRVNELIAKPTEAMVVEASPPKNIIASKAIPEPWGSWIRVGGEKIAAPLHSEAYVFSFELKKSQLIYREARNRGFTGEALANKIAELKYDTPINILTEARTEALKATLMSNQSRLAKYLTGISRFELKNSGLQPLVPFEPFISIAADIFHIATFDALPLGVFTKDIRDKAIGKQGPVKQAEAVGNLTLGLALMGTVAGWMGDGLFNGPGSSDKKKALLDRMTTGYPYSFHIGNQAISIERFGVLGTAISLASDFIKIAEYIKPDDPSYKQFLQAGWGVIHNLGEHLLQGIGPMSGFSKIFDIAKNQSAAEQFARKTIALYEPGSIFFSQAARQLDPYQRDTSDSDPIQAVINQLKVQTPGVSQGLPPRIDIWGQPEPNEKFLGVYMQEVQNDPVMQYFQRHPQNFPSPVKQPQKFKLTHEQLVEYQMKAGLYLKQSLNQLLTPTFEEMSEHSQHLMIQDQVSMARSQAMTELQTKYQGTPHDILKQQLKAQEDMLK